MLLTTIERYVFLLSILVLTALGVAGGVATFLTVEDAYEFATDAYIQTLETRIEVRDLQNQLDELQTRYGI